MTIEKPNFKLKLELQGSGEKDTVDFLLTEEILQLSPREMADYLVSVQKQGRLEEFFERAIENESLLAQFSYWEKWLEEDHQKLLESIIEKKREIYPPKSESLPLELEKRFSEDELKLIFSNTRAIQLTYGCSKGCAFCGFDAVKGLREHIPYSQLVNMFKKYGPQLSRGRPFLYWASEPLDYASKEGLEDRTYKDVHQLAINYSTYDPGITSSNNDPGWIDFMAQKKFSGHSERRLSVFGMKEPQLTQLRLRMAASEEKAEGCPGGNCKIGFMGTIIGDSTIHHIKGIGKSFEQQESIDDIPKSGIACFDGVLLTPRGLFNLFVVPISKEYPQGVIIVPIEGITDQPVKEGENLKEVMRRSVMWGACSHQGGIFKDEKGEYENFQRYTGEFPKKAMIYGKNRKYYVYVDQDGNITKSKELYYRK